MDGVLLVDKPSGPTSFAMVKTARRLTGTRKVGHAGTLDPLASGLLVVCVGAATKLVPYLLDYPKRYIARIALGAETTTDDALGEPTTTAPVPNLTRGAIAAATRRFLGRTEQIPPAYSAIKEGGEPLYRKARRGDTVRPAARAVTIHAIDVTAIERAAVALEVACEKGTYIRSLARDLARALGTRGHLAALRRVGCSGYRVDEACSPTKLQELAAGGRLVEALIPLAEVLRGAPRITVAADAVGALRHGRAIAAPSSPDAPRCAPEMPVCLLDPDGSLVALAVLEDDRLRPLRVFADG